MERDQALVEMCDISFVDMTRRFSRFVDMTRRLRFLNADSVIPTQEGSHTIERS